MKILKKMLAAGVSALTIAALVTPVGAQTTTPTVDVSDLVLPQGATSQPFEATLEPSLRTATGPVTVLVRMADAPLSLAVGRDARRLGAALNDAQQQGYVADLNNKQNALSGQIAALGGRELGRMSRALNGVMVTVDAARLNDILALPGVASIRPIQHYQLADAEVNEYIGATAAVAAGVTGRGVKVAVIDSGVDYTHKELSGPGTLAAYARAYCGNEAATAPFSPACGTAYNNPAPADLFPSAKVYGGFDFVGEVWPLGPGGNSEADRTEDPNPIDFEGHGTHVADIIAGLEGVAPGAQILGVKACSAVAGSCNGVALLKAVEFSLDPNGDGSISDAVDVINMSLGASFGQAEDDLSFASANAVALGVVVVASAGNSADRPYINGSPSSTPGVIAVAQTTVPSDRSFLVKTPAVPAGVQGNIQPWAGTPIAQTAQLSYITTSPATQVGCTNAAGATPYTPGQLSGQIVIIDRGVCANSLKVSNAAAAGAVAVLLANNAAQGPLDPPLIFSFGGGPLANTIPAYTITQAAGTLLKSTSLGQTASIDPAQAVNMVGSMVGSSSRGPNHSFNAIKPDIGAPGASVSAIAGSGTGREAFGGTSGAAPVVAGSAALVLEKFPRATPRDVAARLMNTAFTGVQINPAVAPGVLAPVARIGAGEVRPNAALNATTQAWALDPVLGFPSSLSFGYHAVSAPTTLRKLLVVRNTSSSARFYTISPAFRYRNGNGVSVDVPNQIRVGPGQQRVIPVTMRIDPTGLPEWTLNGGLRGGDGFRMNGIPAGIPNVAPVTGVEFDGYLTISSGGSDTITVPWHVLPRRAATTSADRSSVAAGGTVTLNNSAPTAGGVDIFALTGTGPAPRPSEIGRPGQQNPDINLKAVGVRLVNIGSNPAWQGTGGIQFAVNTWQTRTHPNYPAQFRIAIDTNRDGSADFEIFNQELGGFGATGQNFTFARPTTSPSGTGFFFTDADLNSGNAILTVPLSLIGLTPTSQFTFTVSAVDNYFTGAVKSQISNMTFTPATPRFAANGGLGAGTLAPASSAALNVTAVAGGATASPSQTGLLLMYRNKAAGSEAEAISVTP